MPGSPDLPEYPAEIRSLMRSAEARHITHGELLSAMARFFSNASEKEARLLPALAEHPCTDVQSVARWIIEQNQKAVSLIRDLEQNRRASPLQPGVRVRLGGGYTAVYAAPCWLHGYDCFKGTFVDFADCGPGRMPAAIVKLDEPVILRDGVANYALLRLRYVANWVESETIGVHLVESLPANFPAWFAAHPHGSEHETHAWYEIEPAENPSGA